MYDFVQVKINFFICKMGREEENYILHLYSLGCYEIKWEDAHECSW